MGVLFMVLMALLARASGGIGVFCAALYGYSAARPEGPDLGWVTIAGAAIALSSCLWLAFAYIWGAL